MKTLNYIVGSKKLDIRPIGQTGGVSVANHTEFINKAFKLSKQLLHGHGVIIGANGRCISNNFYG